jgi:hypothetical protein
MIFSKWMVQLLLAIIIPLINGIVVAYLSHLITDNRFLFLAVLASSASYIAVPGMKIAVPKANRNFPAYGTSYYLPFNITFGMPIYLSIVPCS